MKAEAPLVLKDGTVLEVGGVFADAGIYASKTPGAKEGWRKIVEGEVISEQLFVTRSGQLFMISNGDWGYERIKSSSDGGQTWTIEKTTYSPAMQEILDGAKAE